MDEICGSKNHGINPRKMLVQLFPFVLLLLGWETDASPVLLLYCKSLVVSVPCLLCSTADVERHPTNTGGPLEACPTMLWGYQRFHGTRLLRGRQKDTKAITDSSHFSLEQKTSFSEDLKILRLCCDYNKVKNISFIELSNADSRQTLSQHSLRGFFLKSWEGLLNNQSGADLKDLQGSEDFRFSGVTRVT